MKTARIGITPAVVVWMALSFVFLGVLQPASAEEVSTGKPPIQSMGTLEFSPDGWLFIGDSRGGTIFAIDFDDKTPSENTEELGIPHIEEKLAAMLGTTADEIMIHDLAVNPISQNAYISLSRGRGKWESGWQLPNEVADATILLRINPDKSIEEVSLDNVRYSSAQLPNPVDMNKEHMWKKGTTLRVDTITDIVYTDGMLLVTGLSNEEFASTMWQVPFPFGADPTYTTLEIFHGAHGKYETHAPIRTFLSYRLENKPQIIASYLCTPLVTFAISDLKNGKHLKGKTVAEFGSGNYPLDMVLCETEGKEFVVMANHNLPLMTFDPKDIEKQKIGITEEVAGYTAGVSYEPRSGSGVLQLDNFNENYLLALRRMPNGKMDLVSLRLSRLAQ